MMLCAFRLIPMSLFLLFICLIPWPGAGGCLLFLFLFFLFSFFFFILLLWNFKSRHTEGDGIQQLRVASTFFVLIPLYPRITNFCCWRLSLVGQCCSRFIKLARRLLYALVAISYIFHPHHVSPSPAVMYLRTAGRGKAKYMNVYSMFLLHDILSEPVS